jgi:two-component system phosphate regulon sensor histidine kinase PhoR
MKKKTGLLLIVLTSVALVGIVISQVYWVINAYDLKKEQFDQRIHMGLKSISNTLFDLTNGPDQYKIFNAYDREINDSKFRHLNYALLDSLLIDEFPGLRFGRDFIYAVYSGKSQEILGGNYKNYSSEITRSSYRTSMNCLRSGSPYFLALYFPSTNKLVLNEMLGGFALTGLFIFIISFSFIYTIVIIFRQKKVDLMKSDFVNNMTHEFKTPIATVSLASEMLLKPAVQKDAEKTKRYAQIIYNENVRLRHLTDEVLQLAAFDKGKFKIRRREIDVHALLDEVIHRNEIRIQERKGSVKKIYSAVRYKVFADRMHMTNVVSSLIDNANKYSPNAPEITVRTRNIKKGILISVEDKGIGIKAEDQAYVFKQFHRVHTGNVHDVKGFGLGLYYAEKMLKEHGGFIRLKSTFGSGSTFELYFPFNEMTES